MDFDRDWPWLAGVALCAVAAIGMAAYVFGSGTLSIPLIAACIIALAIGQFVTQFASLTTGRAVNANFASLVRDRGRLAQDIGSALQQVTDVSLRADGLSERIEGYRSEQAAASTSIAQGFAELRESHNAITASLKELLERPVETPRHAPVAFEEASPPASATGYSLPPLPAAPEPDLREAFSHILPPQPAQRVAQPEDDDSVPFGDALNLSLEPIVDLYTSQTAHYRMVLGMINDGGQEVSHDMFVHYADRTNARPALDVFVAGEALGILEQLRKRDAKLSIFIPVGAATLASPDSVYKIIEMLKRSPDLSSGLVVDISHAVLASLPESSIEGLALLARSGVVLSLSNAAISGVDLGALGKLNVRFVSLNAANLGLGGRVMPELAGFVQSARALRIQVIVSQVADPRQVEILGRIARYACGAAFAAPRRLRRNGQAALRAAA